MILERVLSFEGDDAWEKISVTSSLPCSQQVIMKEVEIHTSIKHPSI
jgi:hypothetical protein